MNKNQAYQAMCQGHKVCNEYYSPEEYAFINDDGLIEFEDGCVVGNQFSENWVKYQDPECKLEWSICDDRGKTNPKSDKFLDELGNGTNLVFPIHNYYKEYSDPIIVTNPKPFVPKNSHKRTNKRK